MLAMGGEGDVIDRLKSLNMAPVAISYEYDPCDFLKAQEFQLKRDIEDYKKSEKDDLKNMETGLFGFKGRVCFRTGNCLNEILDKQDRTLPKQELFAVISGLSTRRFIVIIPYIRAIMLPMIYFRVRAVLRISIPKRIRSVLRNICLSSWLRLIYRIKMRNSCVVSWWLCMLIH